MNKVIHDAINKLRAEKLALDEAIAALEKISSGNGAPTKYGRRITPAEKHAASQRMKAYWQKRREGKGSGDAVPPTSSD